jgi:hypothetical protein
MKIVKMITMTESVDGYIAFEDIKFMMSDGESVFWKFKNYNLPRKCYNGRLCLKSLLCRHPGGRPIFSQRAGPEAQAYR